MSNTSSVDSELNEECSDGSTELRFQIVAMGRRLRLIFPCTLVWASLQTVVWGDLLHLANTHVIEGIIVNETESQLTVQVAWSSHLTVEQATVTEIVRGNEQEHQQLLDQWHEEFLEAQQQAEVRKADEAAQQAKGLIKYGGQWVTEDALVALKQETAHEAREERKAHRETVRRLEQTITDLRNDNRGLREDIERLRSSMLRIQRLYGYPVDDSTP